MSIRQRGFTLLEVLVAMGVFAVLAVMAYAGLAQATRQDHVLRDQSERFNAIQRALLVIEQDITRLYPRQVRDALGDALPSLDAGRDGVLSLTRFGDEGLQRVAYALQEGQLLRRRWAVLDRVQSSEPLDRPLLDQVQAVHWRFNREEWQEFWPDNRHSREILPRAVELTLQLPEGEVRRLFYLGTDV